MYSRSEATQLKQAFWIAFGQYISPHRDSEGNRINWVNYHTGHKHLYFRMEADQYKASIAVEITHPDELMREIYFDKFLSFRSIITITLGEEWSWEQKAADPHGKQISRISKELKGVNVFDQRSWSEIISFLKPRIILLDETWNTIRDGFEELR